MTVTTVKMWSDTSINHIVCQKTCLLICSIPVQTQQKLLVYQQCIEELLRQCPTCSYSCELTWHINGTFASVKRQCEHCSYTGRWASQPIVYDIPAGNLHLSAAVYFSGMSFAKLNRLCKALCLHVVSESTFFNHVRNFLQPTILSLWNSEQEQLLQQLAECSGQLVLGGDMRADSPGHCAKYGAYTLMDLRSNRVLHVSILQVHQILDLYLTRFCEYMHQWHWNTSFDYDQVNYLEFSCHFWPKQYITVVL